MSEYILELKNITKTFPGVRALNKVNFNLQKGEIHALMGENGAGKSTFIKVITGVHKPDEGTILLDNKEVKFNNTEESKEAGIAAIYQHSTCYPDLSVTENMFLGHEIAKGPMKTLNWKEMNNEANKMLQKLSANFDSTAIMGDLSVAQQQLVEIAKALSQNARIIIMDEPTASLSKKESEELYTIAEQLRDDGKSIIFISHRFEDMYRLASKVTVLRDSNYIGTWKVGEINNEDLITAMVGREIKDLYPKKPIKIGNEVLKVDSLSKKGVFNNISFSVKSGEIVALTGLVGAGRTEVCESIFGISHFDSGKLYIDNKEFFPKNPNQAQANGIGLLPEDRHNGGLVLEMNISENITLSNLRKITKQYWLKIDDEVKVSKTYAERLEIKAPSLFVEASTLSGGNQQKIVVAKILTSFLKVVILDEPTKGVDVGAKTAIYEIMVELAERGYGVLLVSSEMPEVLGMSDKIIVMKEGKKTAELTTKETSQEEILHYSMEVS